MVCVMAAQSMYHALPPIRKTRSKSYEYGDLVSEVQLVGPNGPITVAFQNPFCMADVACSESEYFEGVIDRALSRHPCSVSSPWRIILYMMLRMVSHVSESHDSSARHVRILMQYCTYRAPA